MKKIIISCFVAFGILGSLKAQESFNENIEEIAHWQEDYSKVKKLAKSENKPILIFFTGSDWCGPCKMLVSDVFKTEKFKKLSEEEFILYEANFPRNKDLISKSQKNDNSKLKETFGINTYPTVVILDPKEKELGRLKGYNLMRETSYHYSFFKENIKNLK